MRDYLVTLDGGNLGEESFEAKSPEEAKRKANAFCDLLSEDPSEVFEVHVCLTRFWHDSDGAQERACWYRKVLM